MEINLISDTVTKPTPEMLRAMFHAEVGDDVFGMDPTVNALEEKVAVMFGKDTAIFCPSGTMTNQIAIHINTRPLDEVICDKTSHIYLYELGGYGFNSGIGISLLEGDYGKLNVDLIEKAIKPDADWFPRSRLVTLENSCNKAGGNFYTISEIKPIASFCRENGLKLHLDGARIFNVLVETQENPADFGDLFDTISICLSKGLGAPVGSLLIGTNEDIKHARKVRKVLGGGMRQAGYLAAAGIYALDHHIVRLKTDNERAKQIGILLEKQPYVASVNPVKTNIVIFELRRGLETDEFLKILESNGVLASPMGHRTIRFVFHFDISENMIEELKFILQRICQ